MRCATRQVPERAGRGYQRAPQGPVAGARGVFLALPGSCRTPGAREEPRERAVGPRFAGMTTRSALVAVSRAQLVAQVAGLAVALRRGRYYDVGFMRGSPEQIRRDAVWAGTAYSAPVTMLAAQVGAIRRLRSRPDDGARRVLGLLGVLNAPGYLSERSVRTHLRPGGWDPVETPLVAAAIGLAVAMGVLGHQERSGQ